MSKTKSAHSTARPTAARRLGKFAAALAGLTILSAGALPAAAAQSDDEPATDAGDSSPQMSERERRREERRRAREAEDAARSAGTTTATTTTSEDGDIVVVIEPEMECRKVAQPGSRMTKEVCTPVTQQQDERERRAEQRAEELLRRTREGFGRAQ